MRKLFFIFRMTMKNILGIDYVTKKKNHSNYGLTLKNKTLWIL